MITLLHCNKFHGKLIKGCQKHYLQRILPVSLRGRLSFSVKVGRSGDSSFETRPCCSNGDLKRRLILTERAFHDAEADLWNLYLVTPFDSNSRVKSSRVQFILVPVDENCDHANLSEWNKWEFIGICRSSIMRMELQYFLEWRLGLLNQEDRRCVHVEIFMDKIFDREWKLKQRHNNKSARH